jgi:TolA-binding protein
LDYPESSPEAEKTLRGLNKSPLQAEALRVLSQFYLKNNRFSEAFTAALVLDSVGKLDGKNLLFYMNACLDRKLYQQAISMARYYFSRYADSPSAIEMYFMYGDALSAAGMYDSAVATYSTIVQRSPIPADKGEALYRIGLTHLDGSHRYNDALLAFDSVITNYREGYAWFNAQARRPQIFLKQGDLNKAKEAFTQAVSVQLDEGNLENVQYHLAYVMFLLKEFDSSAVKLRKLTVDFPRGIYMNDALRLQLVVGDASDNPTLLGRYADAERFRVVNQPDSAKTALNDLMTNDDKRLADAACYMLADLMLKQSDTTQAIGYLEQGIQEFGESFYRPYMLKELADLRSLHPQGREAAQQLYRELLEKYPNHPYAADARKRMKTLENAA